MSAHAFVDESKLRGLLLVSAVLAPRDLGPARTALRQLCLPGHGPPALTKERPGRRGEIAAAICRLTVQLDIYDATALTNARTAREACLRAVVRDLATAGGQRLVLEQDDSLVKHDQAVLFHPVRDAGVVDTLAYEHLPARSEPLLWIADAAAWCWAHGRQWQDRIAPVVRRVTTL